MQSDTIRCIIMITGIAGTDSIQWVAHHFCCHLLYSCFISYSQLTTTDSKTHFFKPIQTSDGLESLK